MNHLLSILFLFLTTNTNVVGESVTDTKLDLNNPKTKLAIYCKVANQDNCYKRFEHLTFEEAAIRVYKMEGPHDHTFIQKIKVWWKGYL